MKIFVLSIFFLFSLTVSAQEFNPNTGINTLIDKNYKVQKIERFKGKITFKGKDSVFFNDKLLFVDYKSNYQLLFKLGILYPEVINSAVDPQIEADGKLVARVKIDHVAVKNDDQNEFVGLFETDNLSIGAIQKVSYLKSPKVRRFSFWLFKRGFLNPTEYYFELTNNKASYRTDLQDFIKGSKMTFIIKGNIII